MEHSGLPRPCQSAIGCEKTAVRQVARARRPPVQPYRFDDIGRHVGAGFGRRPSISRRMSANSRRGIATSAIWKVTPRPCWTTLAPILISFSRNVSNVWNGSSAVVNGPWPHRPLTPQHQTKTASMSAYRSKAVVTRRGSPLPLIATTRQTAHCAGATLQPPVADGWGITTLPPKRLALHRWSRSCPQPPGRRGTRWAPDPWYS